MLDRNRWRSPLWVPVATAAALVGILALRLARYPIPPFGTNGVEYKQHADRLAWHLSMRELRTREEASNTGDVMLALDGEFPPGLYAWAEALAPAIGRSAEAVAFASIGWLLVFAAAVGAIAWGLTRSLRVSAAAATGLMLVPAVHGSAVRYYFDLPMAAACWVSVACLLLLQDRRPLLAGLSSGLAALGATLLKWTALPVLAPLLVGVALCGRTEGEPWRKRLLPLGVCLLLWGGAVLGWLSLSAEPSSLELMALEAGVAEGEDLQTDSGQSSPAGRLVGAVVRVALDGDRARQLGLRVAWYLGGITAAVLSPLLSLAVLWLGIGWLRRARHVGAPLAVGALAGHALLLLWLVRPLDERFVLTGVPVLVLLAAVRWGQLTALWQRRWALAVLGVGLAVALDFHHLPRHALSHPIEVGPSATTRGRGVTPLGFQPQRVFRGLSASSSFEQRGWGRQDEAQPPRRALRTAAVEWLERCRPWSVAALEEVPMISETGDHTWLEYEQARLHLRAGHNQWPAITPYSCDSDFDLLPGSAVLTEAPPGQPPSPPPCPSQAPWRLEEVIDDPDGGPGLAIWSADGRRVCLRADEPWGSPPEGELGEPKLEQIEPR